MTTPLEIMSLLSPVRKDSRRDLPEFASIREISVKAFVFSAFFRTGLNPCPSVLIRG